MKWFLGLMTAPDGLVRDRFGGYWCHCSPFEVSGGSKYPFNYQKVSLTWYGRWVKEREWLSKFTPLLNYI
jgi:hypothetical protein